ncbi:hypothetical protein PCYB_003660 [Plasmodium cynomolgi strain B]|uniref:Uncharacterized protein n=1 Tax=Plasmodium cynomolgi (strain B) TaxID=1120755 RepID=K6VJM8_PLACD|nr:hypothetical protein PCYB_003660 [Plasmodium cynomolgi strain B]GAB69617.1 hypothetical protein PCYB_003660 [Plasmodium cynomolgi strain B]
MDQPSLDINEWKANYPFLENVWEMYDEFEKSVEKNEYGAEFYESTCDSIIKTTVKDKLKYNDFCKKLIRNLGAYSTDKSIINPTVERCDIIYSWLYYLIMKYNIPNDFIQKCFGVSNPLNLNGVEREICSYTPYEKVINEANDMLKINIIVANVFTIENILAKKTDESNCLAWKFLYECFNIYKKINKVYCSNGRNKDNENICKKLDYFKLYYGTYIPALNEIPEEKGYLSENVFQFKDKCSLNEIIAESLHHDVHSTGSSDTSRIITALDTVVDKVHSTGSSGPSSTITALGTVAGVSSSLALLYKV